MPSEGWDEEGDPETILMIQDVTEIEARAGSKAVAPAGLPAIVWRADAATTQFLSVAGAAQELTGYEPSRWTSTPEFFWNRIHSEDQPQVRSAYRAAFENGGDATAEFRMLTRLRRTCVAPRDDSSRRARSSLHEPFPVWPPTSAGRKQLESTVATANRVDALHDLAGKLAHDLNNPLMIINGYSEDLLGTFPKQDPRRADVEQILSASRRLTDLTSNLLNFTRRQSQAPTKTDIAKALAELEISIRKDRSHTPVTVDSAGLYRPGRPRSTASALSAIAEGALALTENPTGLRISCQMDSIHEHIGAATLAPGAYARVEFRAIGSGVAESKGNTVRILSSVEGPKERSKRRVSQSLRHGSGMGWRPHLFQR